MKKLTLALLLVLLLTAAPALAALNPPVDAALDWLLTQQQSDGGITSGFADGSDLGATVETILAAVSAGHDPLAWPISPLPYLQAQAATAQDAAALSRLIFAAHALGQDLATFGGVDLPARLAASQDAATGQFGDSLYAHAYAMLALHTAKVAIPANATQLLLNQQQPNGAWAMFGGFEPDNADTNTTALAVQALVAAGKPEAARAALPYFRAMQNSDGGFPWQKPSPYGTNSDANSTASVLLALHALGESPNAWVVEDTSPHNALLALWDEASGAYNWQAAMPGANVLATAQAVQALMGLHLDAVPVVGEIVTVTGELESPTQASNMLVAIGLKVLGVILIAASVIVIRAILRGLRHRGI